MPAPVSVPPGTGAPRPAVAADGRPAMIVLLPPDPQSTVRRCDRLDRAGPGTHRATGMTVSGAPSPACGKG